jgi:hypothetical protein
MRAKITTLAAAMITLSAAAHAQGRPFTFTVPFPNSGTAPFVARYDAGYGYGTFEPLAADRVEQTAELDAMIGSRVMILASTGLALNGPVAARGLAQVEAMVDALRFAGWHLAVSAGARRQYDGSTAALARLGLSHTGATWSMALNVMAGKTLAGGDEDEHDPGDYYASFGATAKIAPFMSVGVETVASDLEGLWQSHEAEGGETVFAGPLVSFNLPRSIVRLTFSGGPIVRTTGNGVPSYLANQDGVPVPTSTPRLGYMLRSAISVGF